MNKFILYYHTLKYLRFKQLFFRLWYKLYQPKISLNTDAIKITKVTASIKFISNNNIYFINEQANFLNHSASISSKLIWNDPSKEKLWLYNLHYFDALNAHDAIQREMSYSLLQRWIRENHVHKKGNAWEPYPISLRIVNIIKYSLSVNALDSEVEKSLYIQTRFLNKICEYHLLGNHLFENFKALCFAGLFFEGPEADRWFQKGFNGLKKEIEEQVLADGGHFELSPMYHCIILEGLLELEQMFAVYARDKEFPWKKQIEKMLVWLSYMMRNADSISYFNDAADGIAHTPKEIFSYANMLGYEFKDQSNLANSLDNLSFDINYLKSSGYIVVAKDCMKAIIDVANIEPDYLLGHAHADTLSFELIVDELPVFVNLGTSCYGNSARREFERSTKAHNTLVVDDKNSSEVWSGFRVARRAKVRSIGLDIEKAIVSAEHNGYKRLEKPIIHKRVWRFAANKVLISDELDNEFKSAVAYLHLHPDCQIIRQENGRIFIALPNGKTLEVELCGAYEVQSNQYAISFGQLMATKSICYLCNKNSTTISIKW
jgi:uncharacterized heparinase superfamily protein